MKHFGLLLPALWGLGGCLLPTASVTQTGAVRGTLLDEKTREPLPFDTVALYRAGASDSSLATGGQTLQNGSFILDKLGLGTYTLRASALGHAPLRRPFTLTAAAPSVALGPLLLVPATTDLAEVTVQGQRDPVVNGLDKNVINVAKDLASVGGTAVNVLQNIPSVTVDQSGQVSLRGTANVTIYIGGKPTGTAGGGRATRLDQIPASRIETVEVMTNPSAKYDAEGGGGIINIVLKKQRDDGVNGSVSANAGTGDKYNTSLSLNRRKGKLNVFLSYDWLEETYDRRTLVRQTATATEGAGPRFARISTLTDQLADGANGNTTHAGRLGFDYAFSDQHSLTLALQPSYNRNRNPEDLRTTLNTAYAYREPGQADSLSTATLRATNLVASKYPAIDYTLDYRRTWANKPRRELTFGAVYSPLKGQQVLRQRQNEGLPLELLQP